jgi:hypothetical protein
MLLVASRQCDLAAGLNSSDHCKLITIRGLTSFQHLCRTESITQRIIAANIAL